MAGIAHDGGEFLRSRVTVSGALPVRIRQRSSSEFQSMMKWQLFSISPNARDWSPVRAGRWPVRENRPLIAKTVSGVCLQLFG